MFSFVVCHLLLFCVSRQNDKIAKFTVNEIVWFICRMYSPAGTATVFLGAALFAVYIYEL